MKNARVRIAVWVLSGALCAAASARTYYVSVTGGDRNPGTREKPFRTIMKGARAAQAGDTVVIGPGRYDEIVAVPNSGAPGKPITFRASEKGKTVVSASVRLGRFTKLPETRNVYYATASPRQCFGLIDETALAAYTLLPTPEACELVPGSFSLDAKTRRIYVHTLDSGDPAKRGLELSVEAAAFYIGHYRGRTSKHDIVLQDLVLKNAWRVRGAGAVFAHGSLRGVVRDCRVENCWIGVNFSLDADDGVVENCDVFNCRDGIRFSYLRRGRILNNRVVRRGDHWPFDPAKPSVGVYPYCWYRDGDNMIRIEGNYIEGYGHGTRLKNPAVAVCRNNTFVKCAAGIGSHAGLERAFFNNLFVDCKAPILWFTPRLFPKKFASDYNCAFNGRDPESALRWLAAYRKLTKQESHGFVAFPRIVGKYPEPMFLAPNSPCIGKGRDGANIGSLPVAPALGKDTRPPVGEIAVVSTAAQWKPPSSSARQREDIPRAEPWKRAREAMTGRRFTSKQAVKLKVRAWDVEGPVTAMQFSNDGRDWAAPVPLAEESTWELSPGDGAKVVYARFKDEAGNESAPTTAEIELKSKAPSLTGKVDVRTNRFGACLSWSPSEPCEAVLHYGPTQACRKTRRAFLYVDDTDRGPAPRHVVFLTVPHAAPDAPTFYRVDLRDLAGNRWVGKPASFKLEGEPKQFFVGMKGDDANVGSRERPWRTLRKATRSALPGDTVTVLAGTYVEPLAVVCGGVSEAAPITYRAEGPVVIERAARGPYGVLIQGLKFVTVEGFEVRGFTNTGVCVLDSANIAIRRNHVHSGYVRRLTLQRPSIGRLGIYVKSSRRVDVEYNRSFWNCRNLVLYFTRDCRVDHNTTADSGVYANIGLWGNNPGAVVTNNIAVGPCNDQIVFHQGKYKWRCDYNCYVKLRTNKRMGMWYRRTPKGNVRRSAKDLAEWQKAVGFDLHGVFADPQFVNRKKGDFRLKPGSPCIGAGENGTNIGAM